MANPVFAMMRQDDLKYDPWGTSMSWHFALCDVMVEWAPPYPPADWKFRQAMAGPDTESFAYQELTSLMESGELSSTDLLRIGNVLHRYEAMLDRAGRSY